MNNFYIKYTSNFNASEKLRLYLEKNALYNRKNSGNKVKDCGTFDVREYLLNIHTKKRFTGT